MSSLFRAFVTGARKGQALTRGLKLTAYERILVGWWDVHEANWTFSLLLLWATLSTSGNTTDPTFLSLPPTIITSTNLPISFENVVVLSYSLFGEAEGLGLHQGVGAQQRVREFILINKMFGELIGLSGCCHFWRDVGKMVDFPNVNNGGSCSENGFWDVNG